MSLARREAEAHGQTIGVHDGVQLAGQSAPLTAHVLIAVPGNAGSVLVHSSAKMKAPLAPV